MARLKTATRTLHNAGVRRVIGLFPSHKNQRMVPWESQIERDFFYDCEFRKDVVRYEAQPREFTYWLEGRSALYTPDAELILTDGTIAYCETKPQEKADAPELQAKWQAIATALTKEGFAFWMVRDTDLRRGHRAQNLRLLYRYVAWPGSEQVAKAVGLHLPRGTLAVEQVIRQFRALGLDAGCVYHALFTKNLECDLESAPINIHTSVWRSES